MISIRKLINILFFKVSDEYIRVTEKVLFFIYSCGKDDYQCLLGIISLLQLYEKYT